MTKEDYISLADKYETEDFVPKDPISLVKHYTDWKDIEVAAVIASWLSYGRRSVFMPKIESILIDEMNDKPFEYIFSCEWAKYEDNFKCLYRMTSWHNFAKLCERLFRAYSLFFSLEDSVIDSFTKNGYKFYYQGLCEVLYGESMIPSPISCSANKRMNMLLRWMVRQNSPVDIGLWNNIPKSKLLVPIDVHSLHAAVEFGITDKVDETKSVCLKVTNFAKNIFPDDPARMDFALYGHGEESKQK